MKISTRGRYALRLMMDLAQHGDAGVVTLKETSQRQEISIKYLEQIVTLSNRGGLIRSVGGNQRGYLLTREPQNYSVGEILRTAEGDLYPVACMEEQPNRCEQYFNCKTIKFWEGLYKVVDDYINGATVQYLTDENVDEDFWCYSI